MEEKKSLSKATEDRKRVLNTDCDSWSADVCENAVYKTNITVEDELLERVSKEVQKLDFVNDTPLINVLFSWPDTPAFNELKEKLSAFSNISDLFIFNQAPFENILPHKDAKINQTSFYLPVFPLKSDYAPFEFYYNNEEYGIVPQEKNNIFILNSKMTHAVFNNGHYRHNVQYRIDQPYKETYNMLKKQGL